MNQLTKLAGKFVFFVAVGIATNLGANRALHYLGYTDGEREDISNGDLKRLTRYRDGIHRIMKMSSPMECSQRLYGVIHNLTAEIPQFYPELHMHLEELSKAAESGYGAERKEVNKAAAEHVNDIILKYQLLYEKDKDKNRQPD